MLTLIRIIKNDLISLNFKINIGPAFDTVMHVTDQV